MTLLLDRCWFPDIKALCRQPSALRWAAHLLFLLRHGRRSGCCSLLLLQLAILNAEDVYFLRSWAPQHVGVP